MSVRGVDRSEEQLDRLTNLFVAFLVSVPGACRHTRLEEFVGWCNATGRDLRGKQSFYNVLKANDLTWLTFAAAATGEYVAPVMRSDRKTRGELSANLKRFVDVCDAAGVKPTIARFDVWEGREASSSLVRAGFGGSWVTAINQARNRTDVV